MARAESLPTEISDSLPQRIGSRISQIVSGGTTDQMFPNLGSAFDLATTGDKQPQVAESFPVWVLDVVITDETPTDLRAIARPLGRWHHQIVLPTGTMAFARSAQTQTSHGAGEWKLRELVEGPLADSIDAAITGIDRAFPDDYVVRLLSIPTYMITAFWILNEETGDQKIIILSPPELVTQLGGDAIDLPAFLNALRSLPRVVGLIDDVPLGGVPGADAQRGGMAEVTIRITIRRAKR